MASARKMNVWASISMVILTICLPLSGTGPQQLYTQSSTGETASLSKAGGLSGFAVVVLTNRTLWTEKPPQRILSLSQPKTVSDAVVQPPVLLRQKRSDQGSNVICRAPVEQHGVDLCPLPGPVLRLVAAEIPVFGGWTPSQSYLPRCGQSGWPVWIQKTGRWNAVGAGLDHEHLLAQFCPLLLHEDHSVGLSAPCNPARRHRELEPKMAPIDGSLDDRS